MFAWNIMLLKLTLITSPYMSVLIVIRRELKDAYGTVTYGTEAALISNSC